MSDNFKPNFYETKSKIRRVFDSLHNKMNNIKSQEDLDLFIENELNFVLLDRIKEGSNS